MAKVILAVVVVAGMFGAWLGRHEMGASETSIAQPVAATSSYTCPMHSHVLSDVQGQCPICGMNLVAIRPAEQATIVAPDPFPVVNLTAEIRNNLSVRTARVERGNLERTVEALGKITRVDPTARRYVTPPIAGELIYVADKYQADEVAEGDLLFTIISDELRRMQSEYQTTFRSGDIGAANAMIPMLRGAGLQPETIAALQAGEPPEFPASVYSNEPGVVFARQAEVGQQVTAGTTVFNLGGDYQVVEVTAEIFERQWGKVAEGQAATMTLRGLPGRVFHGEVTRVEPPVGYTTRSLEIKLKFKTRDRGISQSAFAHVSIAGNTRHNLLLVPSEAVIRTGAGARVVVVNEDGGFLPVGVVVGEESLGLTEVRSGLDLNDKVVVSGQFLIDSESNIIAGFRRLSGGQPIPLRTESEPALAQDDSAPDAHRRDGS